MNKRKLIGKRVTLFARFNGSNDKHMLLVNVRTENGAHFREHLWMPYGKRFRRLEMARGCTVRLRGKVNRYWYKPKQRWQYEVTNVNQFEVIDDEQTE